MRFDWAVESLCILAEPTCRAGVPATSVRTVTPERTCVGCRATVPQDQLIRLALDSAGLAVVIDEQRRTPGRGAYLHRDPRCITQAVNRHAVQRALRAPRADVSALSTLGSALSAHEAALCEKGSKGVE